MNTNTGQIYNTRYESDRTAMDAAIAAGDPVVPVSGRVARLMRSALAADRGRQQRQKTKTRRRDAVAKASRRRNRGA